MKLKHAGSIVRADGGGWGCSEADSKEVVAGEEPVVSQVAGARGGSGGVGGGGSDDATITFGNVNFRRRRQRQRAGLHTGETRQYSPSHDSEGTTNSPVNLGISKER